MERHLIGESGTGEVAQRTGRVDLRQLSPGRDRIDG
jgi:hypothetical protein